MSRIHCSDPSALERANYMKALVSLHHGLRVRARAPVAIRETRFPEGTGFLFARKISSPSLALPG